MADFKWSSLDLNLLLVFDAVMRERSVSKAARALGRTQPAVSHALTRLRGTLEDDLFVRTPAGIVPTQRAEQIAIPIRQTLEQLRDALQPEEFDPASSSRSFRLAVDNYAAVGLVPSLIKQAASEAPGVMLSVRPSGSLDIPAHLDLGELELAICGIPNQGKRFGQCVLREDRFVAVLRTQHPFGRSTRISLEQFAASRMLELTSVPNGTIAAAAALERLDRTPIVGRRVPLHSAIRVLAEDDLIVLVPAFVARQLCLYAPLHTVEIDDFDEVLVTSATWSRRLDQNAALGWLVDIVKRVSLEV